MQNSKKYRMTLLVSALALVAYTASMGCGKKPSSAPQGESAPSAAAPAGDTEAAKPAEAPAAAAGTGTIKGKVNFTGTAPVMPELNRQSDPFCAETKMKAQYVLVNDNNTLKNVAVRVIGASGGEAAPAHVEVDQRNCMYAPRVQTAVFDKEIDIVNGDPTLHNVHTYSGTKTLFNRAQPKGSPTIKHTFTKDDGEIIKFKCDVHPWMTGWLLLNDNALGAVSGDTGEFEIKDVPVGTYTLKAFQETYGEKEIQVTVEKDAVAEVEFSYDGSEKAAYKYKEFHIGFNHEGHEGHQHVN